MNQSPDKSNSNSADEAIRRFEERNKDKLGKGEELSVKEIIASGDPKQIQALDDKYIISPKTQIDWNTVTIDGASETSVQAVPENKVPDKINVGAGTLLTEGASVTTLTSNPMTSEAGTVENTVLETETMEKTNEQLLLSADSIEDFEYYLGTVDNYKDYTAGIVPITDSLRKNIREMNSDLGQAIGLMRQDKGGKVSETSRRIFNEVSSKIGNLPPALQNAYQKAATKYWNENYTENFGEQK